ncbi:hypothetical protein Hanom_Chr17g01525601 [Helianthus anomalus]
MGDGFPKEVGSREDSVAGELVGDGFGGDGGVELHDAAGGVDDFDYVIMV